MSPRVARAASLMLTFFALSAFVRGEDPPVGFDAPALHPATEIAPSADKDKAGAAVPDRKGVLIVIPISANFNTVTEDQVERLRYEIRIPADMDVIDFLPGTKGASPTDGPVNVDQNSRVQSNIKVQFGGEGKVSGDILGWKLSVGGGASRETDDRTATDTRVQYSYRPGLQAIVVAGTKDNRKTLWYDLKRAPQAIREGVQDFAILASVPRDWTGDVLTLRLSAGAPGRNLAEETKAVGVYRAGDESARKRIQESISNQPRPAISEKQEVTNTIGIRLRLIPTGSFEMGSPPKDQDADATEDERPRHTVRISAFRMGVTEVTVGQFRRFVEETGYRTMAEVEGDKETWRNTGYTQTDRHPVTKVSWFDAVAFCNWLSRLEGLKEVYAIKGDQVSIPDRAAEGYRLPTEAEWEYACRAGTSTRFSCPPGELGEHAWYGVTGGSRPVGEKKPNGFGLFDMHGNAWEWCSDDSGAYRTASPVDPVGPSQADVRVFRGGSWINTAGNCRSAFRFRYAPENRYFSLGFRVALVRPSP